MGIVADTDKGAEILIEMITAGGQFKQEVESRQIDFTRLTEKQRTDLYNRLRELLEQVLKLIKEFQPESYSLSVVIPFLGSVGLSWTLPARHE